MRYNKHNYQLNNLKKARKCLHEKILVKKRQVRHKDKVSSSKPYIKCRCGRPISTKHYKEHLTTNIHIKKAIRKIKDDQLQDIRSPFYDFFNTKIKKMSNLRLIERTPQQRDDKYWICPFCAKLLHNVVYYDHIDVCDDYAEKMDIRNQKKLTSDTYVTLSKVGFAIDPIKPDDLTNKDYNIIYANEDKQLQLRHIGRRIYYSNVYALVLTSSEPYPYGRSWRQEYILLDPQDNIFSYYEQKRQLHAGEVHDIGALDCLYKCGVLIVRSRCRSSLPAFPPLSIIRLHRVLYCHMRLLDKAIYIYTNKAAAFVSFNIKNDDRHYITTNKKITWTQNDERCLKSIRIWSQSFIKNVVSIMSIDELKDNLSKSFFINILKKHADNCKKVIKKSGNVLSLYEKFIFSGVTSSTFVDAYISNKEEAIAKEPTYCNNIMEQVKSFEDITDSITCPDADNTMDIAQIQGILPDIS